MGRPRPLIIFFFPNIKILQKNLYISAGFELALSELKASILTTWAQLQPIDQFIYGRLSCPKWHHDFVICKF